VQGSAAIAAVIAGRIVGTQPAAASQTLGINALHGPTGKILHEHPLCIVLAKIAAALQNPGLNFEV
jgi:hypothetical protein